MSFTCKFYDVSDNGHFSVYRSSLKKIFERDDVANSRLVLCVSRIYNGLSRDPKEEVESKETSTRDKSLTENVKVRQNSYLFWLLLDF